MKPIIRSILISFTVLLFTLSPAPCRAVSPTYSHNFNEMWGSTPQILVLSNSNKTGTVARDKITYTCSGGASFFLDELKTNNELAIFLLKSLTTQFVTTTNIQNLDSIWFRYAPQEYVKMTVQISEDSVRWTDVVLDETKNGIRKGKLSRAGDYYVRIAYLNKNVYIKHIEYYCVDPLSGCPNCFIYKPE